MIGSPKSFKSTKQSGRRGSSVVGKKLQHTIIHMGGPIRR